MVWIPIRPQTDSSETDWSVDLFKIHHPDAVVMAQAAIQFFRGVDEPVVPDIRVTRSRDGRTGQATFRFEQPAAIAPETMGDITGMWMVDEEGEMVTREVNGKFVNGKASALEAVYSWKSEQDFERFMRFAQRYAAANGLGYSQNQDSDQTEGGSESEG